MGRPLHYHIVFEEDTEGEPRGILYEGAKKSLEKKLMISHNEGNIHFTPLGLKEIDEDGEIEHHTARLSYKRELEERGFKVTDSDSKFRFPKKG